MSCFKRLLAVALVIGLLAGCHDAVALSGRTGLDDSMNEYYKLPYQAAHGSHFEAKAGIATVQIDGVGYYLFTFYVAPLYAESIKLRYFTLSTVNEKVNAYLNSTAHEPSEIGTIASTAKSFFSDSYFKTWKDASDCQCISFNVLVSDFGADQLSRAGLDAAAFKAALRTMKLTVACSQPASDAISIISDEIVLSAIDETDLVPGCIYEDASWTQLAATGTSNTYMCVYHS